MKGMYTMKIGRKTENSGITIIELIIVIAIVSILISGTIAVTQYISYGNAKKCATTINTALTQVQLENMGKRDVTYLYLYTIDNNYYMKIWNHKIIDKSELTNGRKIANGSVSILYQTKESETKNLLDENTVLKIAFDKRTGAFLNSNYYSKLIIEGRVTYAIHMVKKTGKHYID